MLALLAKVAAVAQFPGFSRWIYAAEQTHDDHVQPRPARYKLQFFTAEEFETRALPSSSILWWPTMTTCSFVFALGLRG